MADQWQSFADHSGSPTPPAGGAWQSFADHAAPQAVDMRPRNVGTAPDAPAADQGFFRSIYETALKPTAELIHDTMTRGDMGAGAADQILTSFKDQVQNFAAHPDIRNLPVIGTGAVATANRMQQQYDAGNYRGMIGSAAGFILPFAAPELAARTPGAVRATADAVKAGAAKLRDALPESIPQIPGVITDVAGTVVPQVAHGINLVNRGIRVANAVMGKKAPPVELTPGEQILASMRQSIADADVANAARPEPEPAAAPEPSPAPAAAAQPAPAPAPAVTPAQSLREASQARWEAARADALRRWDAQHQPSPPDVLPRGRTLPVWQMVRDSPDVAPPDVAPIPATALPSGRIPGKPVEFHGMPLVPESQPAPVAVQPAAPVVATPEPVTTATADADALTEAAAQKQARADEVIAANTTAKATRFADFLRKNKLDPTPDHLARAARELAERTPADTSIPLIYDRMKYTPPTELEDALERSLFERSKAKFDAAKAAQNGTTATVPAGGGMADAIKGKWLRGTTAESRWINRSEQPSTTWMTKDADYARSYGDKVLEFEVNPDTKTLDMRAHTGIAGGPVARTVPEWAHILKSHGIDLNPEAVADLADEDPVPLEGLFPQSAIRVPNAGDLAADSALAKAGYKAVLYREPQWGGKARETLMVLDPSAVKLRK